MRFNALQKNIPDISQKMLTVTLRTLEDVYKRQVIDFEHRSQKQAEALERARLLNEQAEQLKKEADKLGKP